MGKIASIRWPADFAMTKSVDFKSVKCQNKSNENNGFRLSPEWQDRSIPGKTFR